MSLSIQALFHDEVDVIVILRVQSVWRPRKSQSDRESLKLFKMVLILFPTFVEGEDLNLEMMTIIGLCLKTPR